MRLENLAIILREKKISIEIDEGGIRVIAKTEDLTMHELQYMSSVALVHLGGKLYNKNYTMSEILSRGHKMYMEYNTMMKKRRLNGPDVGEPNN